MQYLHAYLQFQNAGKYFGADRNLDSDLHREDLEDHILEGDGVKSHLRINHDLSLNPSIHPLRHHS
jgi:hypothetical protein